MSDVGSHAIGGLARADGAIEELPHPFWMIGIYTHVVGINAAGADRGHVGEDRIWRPGVGRVDLEGLRSGRLAAIRLNLPHANASAIQVRGGGAKDLDAGLVVVLGVQLRIQYKETGAD